MRLRFARVIPRRGAPYIDQNSAAPAPPHAAAAVSDRPAADAGGARHPTSILLSWVDAPERCSDIASIARFIHGFRCPHLLRLDAVNVVDEHSIFAKRIEDDWSTSYVFPRLTGVRDGRQDVHQRLHGDDGRSSGVSVDLVTRGIESAGLRGVREYHARTRWPMTVSSEPVDIALIAAADDVAVAARQLKLSMIPRRDMVSPCRAWFGCAFVLRTVGYLRASKPTKDAVKCVTAADLLNAWALVKSPELEVITRRIGARYVALDRSRRTDCETVAVIAMLRRCGERSGQRPPSPAGSTEPNTESDNATTNDDGMEAMQLGLATELAGGLHDPLWRLAALVDLFQWSGEAAAFERALDVALSPDTVRLFSEPRIPPMDRVHRYAAALNAFHVLAAGLQGTGHDAERDIAQRLETVTLAASTWVTATALVNHVPSDAIGIKAVLLAAKHSSSRTVVVHCEPGAAARAITAELREELCCQRVILGPPSKQRRGVYVASRDGVAFADGNSAAFARYVAKQLPA